MSPNDDSRLNLLELKCRRPVEHVLAGEYRSVFKGRGIEFEDVRPYVQGDDVRAMDWKVTARTRVPHVKRYSEEREQFFFLLVDLSASTLSDRNGAKRKTVSEFCALLTLAALFNNDRVGLILFTDQVELVVSPAKGRQQSIRILDALNSYEPKGTGTRIDVALDAFGYMARKRSVAFVVSDYYASEYEIDLQAAGFRHDLIAVNLIEPFELETPDLGLARLRDAESGEVRVVDFGTGVGKPNPKNSRIREQMLDCGVDLIGLKVGDDCVSVLAEFFKARRQMVVGKNGG